jgi:GxxExxY protein
MILNQLSEHVIGAAIEVHRELGPGLLESVYEACLVHELCERGLGIERQKALPVRYKSVLVDPGLRLDLIVDRRLIVEIKSVERLERVHEKQLLSYLRLSGCHLGLLVNFNVRLMREGIRRIVHRFPEGEEKPIPSAPSASSA